MCVAQIRELGRALRLKADLQEVVVSKEYNAKKYGSSEGDADDADDDQPRNNRGGVDDVKLIIMDEVNFWPSVVDVLKVCIPIVQLLRLCDNQAKEVMGKIYYKMFMIGDQMSKLTSITWIQQAMGKHAERWEYLHGVMHAAGYALDPEYLYSGDGEALDHATMQGLLTVVARLSLRSVIKQAVNPVHARKVLTVDSPQVQDAAAKCMTQFASFRAKEGVHACLRCR